MDILTYILAKSSGGGNGASPPVQESDILSALNNNKDTVKNSLGINELNNEVAEIREYYESGNAGEADWDTLLNKPFYEKQIPAKTYTVDITKEPDEEISQSDDQFIFMYQISDTPLDIDTIKTLLFDFKITINNETVTKTNIAGTELMLDTEDPQIIAILDNTTSLPIFICVLEDNTYISNLEKTITAKGFYGIYGSLEDVSWQGIRCIEPAHTETKQIDKKYVDYDWDNIENKPFGETPVPAQSYNLLDVSQYPESAIVDANTYGENLKYYAFIGEQYSRYLPQLGPHMNELVFEYQQNDLETPITFTIQDSTVTFYNGQGNSVDLSEGNYAEISYTDNDGDNIFKLLIVYNTEGLTDSMITYQGKTIQINQGFYINEYESLLKTSDVFSPKKKICTLTKIYLPSSVPITGTEPLIGQITMTDSEIRLYKIFDNPLSASDFENLIAYGRVEETSSEGTSIQWLTETNFRNMPVDQIPEGISDGIEIWISDHGLLFFNVTKNNASLSWEENSETQTLNLADMGLYIGQQHMSESNSNANALIESIDLSIPFNNNDSLSQIDDLDTSDFYLTDSLFYLINVGVLNLTLDDLKQSDFGMMSLTDPTKKDSVAQTITDWNNLNDDLFMFSDECDYFGGGIFQIKTFNYDFRGFVTFENLGVYLMYSPDGGENNEGICAYLELPVREQINKLDKKYTYTSWNDLEDKPFGEIKGSAITYKIPENASNPIKYAESKHLVRELYLFDPPESENFNIKGKIIINDLDPIICEFTSDKVNPITKTSYDVITYTPDDNDYTFTFLVVDDNNGADIDELNGTHVDAGRYLMVEHITGINEDGTLYNVEVKLTSFDGEEVKYGIPSYSYDNNIYPSLKLFYKTDTTDIIAKDGFLGATITTISDNNQEDMLITQDMFDEFAQTDEYLAASYFIETFIDNTPINQIQFTNKGLYLYKEFYYIYNENNPQVRTKTSELTLPQKTIIKKIDSKYLPDNGGGTSLPSNFPAEGSANANKIVGFDEQGKYTAKIASSGGTGGVSSWNDLTDKPFESIHYEAINLDFSNLSTTDYEVIINGNTSTLSLYKVYDDFVPEAELDYWVAHSSEMGNIPFSQITSDPPIKNKNNSFTIDLSSIQMGYIISVEQDNDLLTIEGLSLNKGFYFDSTFVNAVVTTYGFTLGRLEHDFTKQIDRKYIDYSNIDYTTLSNRPFMDITTESYNNMSLTDEFRNNSLLLTNDYCYYKIGDKYLSEKEAYGTIAYYCDKIDSTGSIAGSTLQYQAYGNNPSIKIKYITGKKDDEPYEYIAGYIDSISKNIPIFLSFPANFNGYVHYKSYVANSIQRTSQSISEASTYVLLKAYLQNETTYYNGIYSIQGNGANSAQKIIDEKYLDVSKDYNLLTNRPFGRFNIERMNESYNLGAETFTDSNYRYVTYDSSNDDYWYYTGIPLTENQLYNLKYSLSETITLIGNNYGSQSNLVTNITNTDSNILIKTEYTSNNNYYYAVYYLPFSITVPILVSVPQEAKIYVRKYDIERIFLAGTYINLQYKDSTYRQGLVSYAQQSSFGQYIKKLDSDYIDWEKAILTPDTKIRKSGNIIVSLEEYIQELVNNMFENGNGGSF